MKKLITMTQKRLYIITACAVVLLTGMLPQKGMAQSAGKAVVQNSANYNGTSTKINPAGVAPVCSTPADKDNIASSTTTERLRAAIAERLKTEQKVRLDLFVMSQCPFGVMAEQLVAPVVQEFGKQVEFRLNFIAGEELVNGRTVFNSLHGQPEIDEDIRQLIIASSYPEKLLPYLLARAENYREENWQTAAAKAGIDVQALSVASMRRETQVLFRANIKQAQSLGINGSPTLLIDGVKYTGGVIDPTTSSATACQTGTDPFTGAAWTVCAATATTAWITSTATGGQYHAEYICRQLGYANLGRYGGTCGTQCGYCTSGTSCTNPQANPFFEGNGFCGTDANGPILCFTVHWECVNTVACVPPSFTNCPGDITVSTDNNSCDAVVTYNATAAGTSPTLSYTFTGATTGSGAGTGSGSAFNQGTTTVTITASNSCGTATCSFTVTVNDDQPPTITCPANITLNNTPNTCSRVVNYPLPAATDNCGGNSTQVTWTLNTVTFADGGTASGSFVFNAGTNTYTNWSISVSGGNTGNFPPVIYTPSNSNVTHISSTRILFELNSSTRGIRFSTFAPKTNAGGTLALNIAGDPNFNLECFNCSPFRFMNGGSLVGTPGLTITQTTGLPSGSNFPVGTTTNTFMATDAAGNNASCSFTVTVNDAQPPTITCPLNITVPCASLVPPPNPASVTANDNCPGVTVSWGGDVISNQTCANRYTITRTYRAIDVAGNPATCTQTITVFDDIPPMISCPQPVTVQCASAVPPPSPTTVNASDNCGQVTVTWAGDVISNQTCQNRYTITRTYRATDACGLSVTCTQIITVFDDIRPTITCPPSITVQCAGDVPPPSTATVTASDNCGVVNVFWGGDVITGQTCANRYTITRIYVAVDLCGNSNVCAQTILVNSTTGPTIICPDPVTVQCASDVPNPDVESIIVTANCGGAVTVTWEGDVISDQTCANRYTITRTYRATDICGNSSTCTQIIRVFDDTPPTITCPAPVTVQCASAVPPPAPNNINATDNCTGAVVVTWVSDVISNQVCANRYTITRTYRATDACGNSATCTQTITVFDITPPTITCPQPITVQCAGDVPAPNPASVTASDNCGQVTVTWEGDVISNQTCPNRYTLTRTYRATDACGNSRTCAQTIIVNDNTPPTITCPAPITVQCASAVPAPAPNTITASDNCGPVTVFWVSDVIGNQTCANRYTITRIYTAVDACGNNTNCTQIITVNDDTPPVISCPQPITVQCASNVPAPAPSTVTATDNCGQVTVTWVSDVISNQTCANRYRITRTYRATDACGQSATCTQIITVFDDIPPTMTCPAAITVQCSGAVPQPAPTTVTATDNCTGIVTVTWVSDVISNQTCANRYTITRTYKATDVCGNSATCTQTITVFDNTPPTITCPAPVTVQCASFVPQPAPGTVTAIDNCPGAVVVTWVSDVISNQVCANRYTITRTYRATDACGNSATCTQTITVFDETPPTISCPQPITVSCTSAVPAPNPASVTASDNCGSVTVTWVGDVISNQTCANRYTITRTYRATDACGNSRTCAQTITVFDNTPPTITCPAPITVQCASAVPAPNPASVTASDNCGSVTVTWVSDVISNQTCANRYTLTRTYRATDACGLSATCTQIITVNDNTPPVITCPAAITVKCAANVPAPAPSTVTATDNCGQVTVTWVSDVISNQTCANRYRITRTYRATDACGQSATCTQIITVFDDIPPTMTCPAAITVQCSGAVPQPAPTTVIATDNCGGTVVVAWVSDVISNQTCANRYTITRTYKATDVCGNSATCTQIITVFDNTPPTITCPAPVTVQCASFVPQPAPGTVTATDNCPGAVVVTWVSDVISNQVCANRYTLTRTYRATDACGNSATCTQTITVFDETPPTIICPQPVTVQCASSLPPNPASVTASDNCGSVTVTWVGDVISNQTCANRYTITRTYRATDACGNSRTCAQTITVFDNTPPTITCPAPVTVQCASAVPAPSPASVTASDNCGSVTVTWVSDLISNQTCANRYTLTRTYRATDACGLSATCTQIITVNDNTSPVIVCPQPITVQCPGNVPAPAPSTVTATDNCGQVTVTWVSDVITNQTCASRYWIMRTYRAADACGNSATCTQLIIVFDDIPPTITCPAPITVQCSGAVPQPAPTTVTATDNCTGTVVVTWVSDVISNQTCANRYMITRTYKATDVCGNSATCTQTIIVFDGTSPVITCPPDITVQCASAVPARNFAGGSASDNCGQPMVTWVSDVISNQTCANRYTITRTYTATDGCGNSATCTQRITVFDETPPTIICPQPITVQCASVVPAPNPASVTASDNCGSVTVTWVGDVISNQTCANRYTITRTYRATDACGNSRTCTQVITVFDNIAPTFTCPSNKTIPFTGPCTYNASPTITGSPTNVSDNCTGAVTVTFTDNVSQCGNSMVITRTWKATDVCGNSRTCIQTITVSNINTLVQTEEPVITAPAETFGVHVYPNPSAYDFNIIITSRSNEPVTVRILDMNGTVKGVYTQLSKANSIKVGSNLVSGTYMAEVIQGTSRRVVKLIKLN